MSAGGRAVTVARAPRYRGRARRSSSSRVGCLADADRDLEHLAGVGADPDPEVVAAEGPVDDGRRDGDPSGVEPRGPSGRTARRPPNASVTL